MVVLRDSPDNGVNSVVRQEVRLVYLFLSETVNVFSETRETEGSRFNLCVRDRVLRVRYKRFEVQTSVGRYFRIRFRVLTMVFQFQFVKILK